MEVDFGEVVGGCCGDVGGVMGDSSSSFNMRWVLSMVFWRWET